MRQIVAPSNLWHSARQHFQKSPFSLFIPIPLVSVFICLQPGDRFRTHAFAMKTIGVFDCLVRTQAQSSDESKCVCCKLTFVGANGA